MSRIIDSRGDLIFNAEPSEPGLSDDGDHVFRTGGVERARIKADGTATGLLNGGSIAAVAPSGFYLRPSNLVGSTSSGSSFSVGPMRVCPFAIGRAVTIAAIRAKVSVAGAAGSVVRLGIYAASELDGTPDALVIDAGTIDGTSATAQEIAINVRIAPGLYWGAACVQVAACTLVALAPANAIALPSGTPSVVSDSANPGYRGSINVDGPLPATFDQVIFQQGSSGSPGVPMLALKVA